MSSKASDQSPIIVQIIEPDVNDNSIMRKFDAAHLLKYLSLVILVVQNASQVLLIRYARTRAKKEMFLSTTAVFWSEVLKLITCICIVSWQEGSPIKCAQQMYRCICMNLWDTAKVCVPSFIYTFQNNLLYVAVSHLAAATFMVTYQLKILTTAIFSVTMLGKPISRLQWFSLLMLFAGVSLVQLQENAKATSPKVTLTKTPSYNNSISNSVTTSTEANLRPEQNPIIGLVAVIVACLMSGFSGIYFEKILKGAPDISVWMRNIQLAVLSIPISFATMHAKDGHMLSEHGMYYGYDSLVWTIIVFYAIGGLTVAVVIKYADNILKGFATSLSIVVATVVSIYLFDFMPSLLFVLGTALVMLSIYLYSKYPPKAPPPVVRPV